MLDAPRSLQGESKAEAKDAVVGVGRTAATARYATTLSATAPAATATHAYKTTFWPCGICLCTAAIVLFPILAPFPYITAHVEDTQFVR